ncbi:peptidase M20 [Izhakiella australiensis]|uniref:Peptidase M20 n=1 Tax=Izhakiella australiensis TaxID=1926881 RepID=A0A1S8YTG2_9GAMM|nr:dipeptidase [Izhakiella australiensis]OON42037.1 peptidase M20 [Izhakiella australiensis]
MTSWQRYLQQHQAQFIEQMSEFLRIPSISAQPEHLPDVWQCARWLVQRLESAGICQPAILQAGEYPLVYGEWLEAGEDAPTILIYGHFDVQPVEPLSEWHHPPFEPWIEDDKIYARGASDDKGNMLVPIVVLEALLRTEGRLPVNVKLLFEGQEEILSPDLPAFIAAHKTRLACDLVVSADGWQWSESEADLRTGLRGLCALEVTVSGPRQDVHAGTHGGALANPIHGLAQLLSGLHDEQGRVCVPGFYQQVKALTQAEREQLNAIPFDEAQWLARVGVTEPFGEQGYTTRERIGIRPTLEVNGISGGYQGHGVKTIIPARATAKITCRLVPDQHPQAIAQAVADHLHTRVPPGVTLQVKVLPNGAHPYYMASDHPGNQAAAHVLEEIYGRAPYYTRSGGSIALLTLFQQQLGVCTVIFGFGLPDENFHAPNEFFRLAQFARGQRAWGALLLRLAATRL